MSPAAAALLLTPQSAPLSQLGVVLFLGVFPSALAYLPWAKALACAARTSTATNYMYLTPFLALLLEYLIIAETPGPGTFVGEPSFSAACCCLQKRGKRRDSSGTQGSFFHEA